MKLISTLVCYLFSFLCFAISFLVLLSAIGMGMTEIINSTYVNTGYYTNTTAKVLGYDIHSHLARGIRSYYISINLEYIAGDTKVNTWTNKSHLSSIAKGVNYYNNLDKNSYHIQEGLDRGSTNPSCQGEDKESLERMGSDWFIDDCYSCSWNNMFLFWVHGLDDSVTLIDESSISEMKPFTKRSQHYNKVKQHRGSVIVVEGVIGVGKSTLGRALEAFLTRAGVETRMFEEEVNTNLLNLFLSNMKKYAFAFQLYMFQNRQRVYQSAREFSEKGNGISIIDRSLLGDIAFATMHKNSGNISGDEWKAYEEAMNSNSSPEPTTILYLKAKTETIMKRISKRARNGEVSSYTNDYINSLSSVYDKVMDKSGVDVVTVDWDQERFLTDDEMLSITNLL